jgi:hypothetical protein
VAAGCQLQQVESVHLDQGWQLKTHPKKLAQKNPPKKPTKNGFLGVFLILNFL